MRPQEQQVWVRFCQQWRRRFFVAMSVMVLVVAPAAASGPWLPWLGRDLHVAHDDQPEAPWDAASARKDRAPEGPGAARRVSVPVRPFAVDSLTMQPEVDGIFVTSRGEQLVGVYLILEDTRPLGDVVVTATFPFSPEIRVLKATQRLDELRPAIPTLLVFGADFTNATPGRHVLVLELSSSTHSEVVATEIWAVHREWDPDDPSRWVTTLDDRRVTVETLATFGGEDERTRHMATWDRLTVDYDAPFAGQYGPLPFTGPRQQAAQGTLTSSGPGPIPRSTGVRLAETVEEAARSYIRDQTPGGGSATKTTIADVAFGVGVTSGTAALANACVPEPFLTKGAAIVFGAVALGSSIVGFIARKADEIDPIRWGQSQTRPEAGEVTIREVAEVKDIRYNQAPLPGQKWSAVVQWNYTRITNLRNHPAMMEWTIHNLHYTTDRLVTVMENDEGHAIHARFEKDGALLAATDAFVLAQLRDPGSDQLLPPVVLRDDGNKGDLAAADGIYTTIIPWNRFADRSHIEVYVFAYDHNRATLGDDAVASSQKLGGLLVSPPRYEGNRVVPDATLHSGWQAVNNAVSPRAPLTSQSDEGNADTVVLSRLDPTFRMTECASGPHGAAVAPQWIGMAVAASVGLLGSLAIFSSRRRQD